MKNYFVKTDYSFAQKIKKGFRTLSRFPTYYAVADVQRASAFDMREKASYRK
jgi:hypothetical protein